MFADKDLISDFVSISDCNERKRVRLCSHKNETDSLHEMLIVHEKNAYVRPHKHISNIESLYVLSGSADLVLFSDDRKVNSVINLSDFGSDKVFYYRLNTPIFHTLLVKSDKFVFHEVTSGPFLREQTIFPDWAPSESQHEEIDDFIAWLIAVAADLDLGRKT